MGILTYGGGRDPAARDRVELGLTGMTCAACAARIEKVLNRIPGVQANVNFATDVATVRASPATTTVDQLLAAVARAGYGASVRRDAETERADTKARRQREYRALRREFILAAFLTLPLLAQMAPMLASGDLLHAAHADMIPRGWQLLLATPVQFWSERRFYDRRVACVARRRRQHGCADRARNDDGVGLQRDRHAARIAPACVFRSRRRGDASCCSASCWRCAQGRARRRRWKACCGCNPSGSASCAVATRWRSRSPRWSPATASLSAPVTRRSVDGIVRAGHSTADESMTRPARASRNRRRKAPRCSPAR